MLITPSEFKHHFYFSLQVVLHVDTKCLCQMSDLQILDTVEGRDGCVCVWGGSAQKLARIVHLVHILISSHKMIGLQIFNL